MPEALPGLREVYQAYARAADELPALRDPLRAALWTSAQLGALESAAPHTAGHRLATGDLIAALHRAATPGTYACLLAIAAVGPQWGRRAAAKAASGLSGRPGLPRPSWAATIGRVSPGPVWLIQEGPLDGDRLVCEFRHAEGPHHHALAVRLMPDGPSEIIAVADVAGLMGEVRKAVQAELCTIQPVAPAAAGARLRNALNTGHRLPADCYRALALARHRAEVM